MHLSYLTIIALDLLLSKNINTIITPLNNIFESEELVKSEVTFNPNDSTNGGNVIINHDAKTQPILYAGYHNLSRLLCKRQTGNTLSQTGDKTCNMPPNENIFIFATELLDASLKHYVEIT
jgi:hypothetical protein